MNPAENRNLIIDVCSGLGGASQAFVDAGEEVIHVDIDKRFKPEIVADVQNLPFKTGLKPKLIIFCPPCPAFSLMAIWHYWDKGKPKNAKTEKAIRLVKRGLEEIRRISPRYWIMENPMGMLRKVIGKPRSTIRQSDYGAIWKKPTDLWGNVPFRMLLKTRTWLKSPRGSHLWETRQGPDSILLSSTESNDKRQRSAQRAKWPYGLSQAVMEACS